MSRSEVIKAFRKLHRTRQFVFAGDDIALAAGRNEINKHFRKNIGETNQDNIKKMVKLAVDVEKELRTTVIQAKQKEEGIYELRITDDITRLDNIEFNPDAVIEPPRRKGKAASGCSGGGGADTKSTVKEQK